LLRGAHNKFSDYQIICARIGFSTDKENGFSLKQPMLNISFLELAVVFSRDDGDWYRENVYKFKRNGKHLS